VGALARRFGWNATSFQVLEPGYAYFFPDDDACVAYVDTGRAWVAAGPPLADDARLSTVAAAFVEAARAASRRACFFGTEERFTTLTPLAHLLVGTQAVWDPAQWNETLSRSRSLREQLRRARAKGVRVRALPLDALGPGAPAGDAIAALVARWHRTRELAPLGFLARAEPLPSLPEHTLFVAELAELSAQDDRLVGFLSVAPIFQRGGWLLQNLLRAPEAPNGTAEALVDHAMREAAARGTKLVTLGLAPLAGEVAPPLRFARAAAADLYNFEGLRAFKAKLQPTRWDRIFVSYPAETGVVRALVDVLGAFARDGFLRFGLRTLLRGPAVVVSLLTMLLVPWTALLASVDARIWFPSPSIKWAWVGFDALLAVGLFTLRARWREGLARALTFAVGADALVTASEAVWWNLPRAPGLAARIALAVAVAAPLFAFFVLRGATARRSA
jgi:phosphatidylglycerol lysyltransferase